MEQVTEASELLAEDNIISNAEKKAIISRIDKDFLSFFENTHDLKEFSQKSKGLIMPLSVGLGTIIVTVFIMLFFLHLKNCLQFQVFLPEF